MSLLRAFIIFSFLTGPCSAQGMYDQIEYDRLKLVMPSIKRWWADHMDKEDGSLLKSISVKIDRRNLTNAFADRDANGKRRIVIFNGIGLVFSEIATASTLFDAYPLCAQNFLTYMYEQYEENTKRVLSGLSSLESFTVAGFLNSRADCQDALSYVLNLPPERGGYYAAANEASLGLLLLHEFAHHKLGHVDQPNNDVAASRDNEDAADTFAIEQYAQSRDDLILAFPFFVHLAITGGATLEDENHSSHPLGLRRFLKVLQKIESSTDEPQVKANVQKSIHQIEDLVPH